MRIHRRRMLALWVVLAFIVLFFFLRSKVPAFGGAYIDMVQEKVLSFGPLAPLAFIVIMVLAVLLLGLPISPLNIVAGLIWGPYLGTFYAVIGAEIGAVCAFLIARRFGKRVFEKVFGYFYKVPESFEIPQSGFVIFLSRLFPIFPFSAMSYFCGLKKTRFGTFVLATLLGMIIPVFLIVTLGIGVVFGEVKKVIFSLVIIALLFAIPVLLRKYRIRGLKIRGN